MKKNFKSILLGVVASLVLLPTSNAFFLGSDLYTQEEYAEAEIVHKKNTIFLDEYYFNGQKTDQKLAEKLTTLYRNTFKKENTDGTKDTNMQNIYNKVAQFALNISKDLTKDLTKELDSYKSDYYSLLAENMRLKQENYNLNNANKHAAYGASVF